MPDTRNARRQDRRLRRQFDVLARTVPQTRATLRAVLDGRFRLFRLPLALLLVAGGFLAFLPVLGTWMLPLGLLLLAVDIPLLRPAVSGGVVRARRRLRLALGTNGRFARIGRLFRRGR